MLHQQTLYHTEEQLIIFSVQEAFTYWHYLTINQLKRFYVILLAIV